MAGLYAVDACGSCGARVWRAAGPEREAGDEGPPSCGRCRLGLSPALAAADPPSRAHAAEALDQMLRARARRAPPRFLRPLGVPPPGGPPAPAAAAPLQECPVCLEGAPAGERAEYARVANESWENRQDRCDAHGVCKACLQTYVEVKILDEGLWNIRCPGERCRYRLVDEDVQSALAKSSRSSEAWAKRQQLRKQSFAPRLEEMLQASEAAARGAEIDETLELLLAECQVCPACSVLVRREGGCPAMVCRCSQEFCFCCGAPLDDSEDECACDEEDEGDGELPMLGLWLKRRRAREQPDPDPEQELEGQTPEGEGAGAAGGRPEARPQSQTSEGEGTGAAGSPRTPDARDAGDAGGDDGTEAPEARTPETPPGPDAPPRAARCRRRSLTAPPPKAAAARAELEAPEKPKADLGRSTSLPVCQAEMPWAGSPLCRAPAVLAGI